MEDDARTYFRDRAEAELQAGQSAQHPRAAQTHFLLAGLYLDRAFNAPTEAEEIDDATG